MLKLNFHMSTVFPFTKRKKNKEYEYTKSSKTNEDTEIKFEVIVYLTLIDRNHIWLLTESAFFLDLTFSHDSDGVQRLYH